MNHNNDGVTDGNSSDLPALHSPSIEHPLLAQYNHHFRQQLARYQAIEQPHDTDGSHQNAKTDDNQFNRSLQSPSIPSISLQPMTFATKIPTMSDPSFQHEANLALINLSPTEEAIFKTIRKIVNFYGLKCNPRVAGGWVRDKLLHKESHDIDIALEGMEGETFAHYIRSYSQSIADNDSFPDGKKISTISVIKSNPTQSKHLNTATFVLHGLPIDVSNLRTEVYAIDSRIPMMQMGSVRDDVIRRDFTCNALFYNIMTEEIEDICGRSKYDLDHGIISTPLHAFKTFNDDPLRVLRCVRFASRLRFTIDSPIYYAASHMSTHLNLVKKVSRERYGIELRKMFESFTTTQFSLSLLCQWKLRPLIFMLPMNYWKEFKAQAPQPKGKKAQDEMQQRLQELEHLDQILHSQIAINPALASRFPMYSLYDLAPRTVFQALFPKEFAKLMQDMHQSLMPPIPTHPNHHTHSCEGIIQSDQLNLRQQSWEFEFAPYAMNDIAVTTHHQFLLDKYTDQLNTHFQTNKHRLVQSFARETNPFDVEFVPNSNPYTRTTIRPNCLKSGPVNVLNQPLTSLIQQPGPGPGPGPSPGPCRPKPQFPPKLSFFTLHEDTCLTSLCSQSLSSFRILCEKIYGRYFCAPSLPGITLPDQKLNTPNSNSNSNSNSGSSSSSGSGSAPNSHPLATISPVLAVPIPDDQWEHLSQQYNPPVSQLSDTTLCINVIPASRYGSVYPISVSPASTLSIPVTSYTTIYQTAFTETITALTREPTHLVDDIYDAFHLNSLSQHNIRNVIFGNKVFYDESGAPLMPLAPNPIPATNPTLPISNPLLIQPSSAPPVYTTVTPSTSPQFVLIYTRQSDPDVGYDDCTTISGSSTVDTYHYQLPVGSSAAVSAQGNSAATVQIHDPITPNYSLLPINPDLFPSQITPSTDYVFDKSCPRSESNLANAVQRALLSLTTSTASNSVLSKQFHSLTLQQSPTPSLLSTYSHLQELRQLGIQQFSTLPQPQPAMLMSPLSDGQIPDSQQELSTDPILTTRTQTPFTPTSDIFRITLYASFLWPYYGFTMVDKKGKQRSILYYFLVDSLKLAATEGDVIEIIIEAALTVIQLSYQWNDITKSLSKQLTKQLPEHCPKTLATALNHKLNLDKINTTQYDYQPIKSIQLCRIDEIFAQRITHLQAQLGAIVTRTASVLAPTETTVANLSPMIYNSTLDAIVLLAFNIQTVMNMPLYKLPQPQHTVTLSSTLQFTSSEDYIANNHSPTDQDETRPPLSATTIRTHLSGCTSPRQQTRTDRITTMLKKHPLVLSALTNQPSRNDNVCSQNNHNDDEINSTMNDNDFDIHQQTIKKQRLEQHSTALHSGQTDPHVQLSSVTVVSRASSRAPSQPHTPSHTGSTHADSLRGSSLIAVYEPLSQQDDQVPLAFLPQPLQDHILSAVPSPTDISSATLIDSTSPGLNTIQLEQAKLIETQAAMSQYLRLIPPQPRNTPYVHDEIPSTYSLFSFPGLSLQLQFKTSTPDDFAIAAATPTPLSSHPVDVYNRQMDRYHHLKQITPSINVDRKLNLDSLPMVSYSESNVILTQTGFDLLMTSSQLDSSLLTLPMDNIVFLLIQTLAAQTNIDLNSINDVDITSYNYYGLDLHSYKQHINHQKRSLLLIYGLSRGYLRLRTTPIAQLARNVIYTNNNAPFSMQFLHALHRPLFPGPQAVSLTKEYKSVYARQLAENTHPPSPYPSIQGPIQGKMGEHLLELKYWYPYVNKDDIAKAVEKIARFELIPANELFYGELCKALQDSNAKK